MKGIFLLLTVAAILIFACTPKPMPYKYVCEKSNSEFLSELRGILNYGGFEMSKLDTSKDFYVQARKFYELKGQGKKGETKYLALEIKKNYETKEVSVAPMMIEAQGKSEDYEYLELKTEDRIWDELKISIDRIKKICESKNK